MLSIRHVSKKFGTFSLEDINLEIVKGEYFALLGPSGAGKSLLFELIAGIYLPDSGEISLNNINITKLPVDKRNIGLVFQDNTLFPHYSVFKNIAYPLRINKCSGDEIEEKINSIAQDLSIAHLLNRNLETLSGGEIQRISLARALVNEPQCILLDEPVTSLDPKLKTSTMALLQKINKSGMTMLHITHDLNEAVYLADRMAIIDAGKIIQTDKPETIYKNPASEFVAGFLGYKNIFSFKSFTDQQILIGGKLSFKANGKMSEGMVIIPDYAIKLLPHTDQQTGIIEGTLIEKTEFPDYSEWIIEAGISITKKIPADEVSFKIGQKIYLRIDDEKLIFRSVNKKE